MIAVAASDTQLRVPYRRTRGDGPGVFWARAGSPARVFGRIAKLGSRVSVREVGLLRHWRAYPDTILMWAYRRGIDPLTGDRFEVRRLVLLDPKTRLVRLSRKPGFSRGGVP